MSELLYQEKDILLAEDDPDDVEIFEIALQELKLPFILRHAKNGDTLFILLKQKLPYILFLDIGMPCRDGIACIAEIRKNREYDRLPIIVLTAHSSRKMINDCFEKGANLYLTKAYTINELTRKLSKIFAIDWENYRVRPSPGQFVL